MAQNHKQSIKFPKTHAHIMLEQLNIKDGLEAYGNKGDEAIFKAITYMTSTYALKQT